MPPKNMLLTFIRSHLQKYSLHYTMYYKNTALYTRYTTQSRSIVQPCKPSQNRPTAHGQPACAAALYSAGKALRGELKI